MGDIRNNITSGSIGGNDTTSGVGGVFNNNAFSSNGINNSATGQGGYNYPDTNTILKTGHFISSDGTNAVWTTINDYSLPVGPNFATDYLFMWCAADQKNRKILMQDVIDAGGTGAVIGDGIDKQVAIWTGAPDAVLTSDALYTYDFGTGTYGNSPAYFRVGYMIDNSNQYPGQAQYAGRSTFFANGKTVFESVAADTNVFIKASTDAASESGKLIINRRRGEIGTESSPLLNDTIGEIFFNAGATSSSYTTAVAASITVTASENFGTNFGSSLSIKTTKVGQTASSERLLIDSDGSIKITGQQYSTLPTLISPTANAIALNWNTGNGQAITLTGATGTVTVTLTNPKAGAVYLIKITQSSTTARNITWPANVKWSGSVVPTITTALNAIDTVALFYDGTNYYANISQNYG